MAKVIVVRFDTYILCSSVLFSLTVGDHNCSFVGICAARLSAMIGFNLVLAIKNHQGMVLNADLV